MNRVLVVSPHPDDEAVGCGGTLRRHVVDGDAVHVIFLTSGEEGGHGRDPDETAQVREREAIQAVRLLGFGEPEFWREPDGAIRATDELVARLVGAIEKLRPSFVYVPHAGEMHADHQQAFLAVRQALATTQPSKKPRPLVRLFEVWTPIQEMDEIVDISEFIEEKIEAVRVYESQCSVLRFDDAIRGLNRYRGEMHSWPGGDYAEVFQHMQW